MISFLSGVFRLGFGQVLLAEEGDHVFDHLFVGVHRDMLENAWKYMDREWGGAVGYLTSCCGVSMDEIETLRERYIEA